ncbi:MAG: hypothetical protein Q8O40_12955 [Chloroflexota bacterium]|nr:hypothetical protein [Chloroflexota bacterium]
MRGHFGVCFLALVMESTLTKLLKERRPRAGYREVMRDLRRAKAARLELNDKPFPLRMELDGQAYSAFEAVRMRPPPRLQPLPRPS